MNPLKKILSNFISFNAPQGFSPTNEADAVILEYSCISITNENRSEMRVLFHVTPKTGRNFITECRLLIHPNQENMLYTGCKMKVTIDPRNAHKILQPHFT